MYGQEHIIKEAIGEMRAELRSLRADLGISQRAHSESAEPEAPEWVWVVCSRDPDDSRRVSLVTVAFTEEGASAAIARVRTHEKALGVYPAQLGVRKMRVGVNYMYELDGEPRLDLF